MEHTMWIKLAVTIIFLIALWLKMYIEKNEKSKITFWMYVATIVSAITTIISAFRVGNTVISVIIIGFVCGLLGSFPAFWKYYGWSGKS